MLDRKTQILHALDPRKPDTVQALIDYHRTTLGGWRMMADPAPADNPQGDPAGKSDKGGDPSKPDDGGDEPLGEGGLTALRAERDARKSVEQEFQQFRNDQQAKWDQLAEAIGVKKDAKSGEADVVKAMQTELANLKTDNLVEKVARTHKITDEEDLELLRSASSEEAMRKLAKRLQGTGDKPDDADKDKPGEKRRLPKPDPSQGRGGEPAKPGEAGKAEAARRFPKAQGQQ